MKNKKRKIVSLALAAIMAFSAFYTSGGLSFADETEVGEDKSGKQFDSHIIRRKA